MVKVVKEELEVKVVVVDLKTSNQSIHYFLFDKLVLVDRNLNSIRLIYQYIQINHQQIDND